jgi:Spy/CpxP family protein refolding chaperone
MKSRAIRVLVGAAILMVAGAAAAQPLGVPMGRWWEWPRVAERLSLAPEQTQKLDAITLNQATVMVDLKASVEKAEINLRAAADAQPFDAKRVRDAFGVLQQARMKLEAQRFEMLLKTREVLTVEQWQKLRELARERRMERGKAAPGAGGTQPRSPRAWPD